MSQQDIDNYHKHFAIEGFNQTWDFIEKEEKNQQEIDLMINAAHASRYHWEKVGEAVNIARGEWLISKVYAILHRLESCLYHARRCYEITLENDLKDFDLAFGYEAMARASNLAGDEIETAKYLTRAKEAGAKIQNENDRKYFFRELGNILPETFE